jgi:hypothetical protein
MIITTISQVKLAQMPMLLLLSLVLMSLIIKRIGANIQVGLGNGVFTFVLIGLICINSAKTRQ